MMDMKTRMLVRATRRMLPALTVTALLCLAAAAPRRPGPSGVQMPSPPPVAAPCTDFSHTGGGDSAVAFAIGDGLIQPLPDGIAAVGCSLSVKSDNQNNTYLMTSIQEWDPATLAPDPETVALRTEDLNPSAFSVFNGYAVPWLAFVPPIITRAVLGVAEPPRPTVALRMLSYNSACVAHYQPEGDPDIGPAAMVSAGGTHGPLLGSHPVIGHAICSGDADLQYLRIVQSVRRTDATLADRPEELVQSFRVPERVELRWVELALAGTPAPPAAVVSAPDMPAPSTVLAIVDPEGAPAPPATMPPSLIETAFTPVTFGTYYASSPTPRWASHLDFDHTITLLPGHDYWLYLRAATPYTFLARTLTGDEGGDFTAGVGPLHQRAAATDPWTPVSATVLAFKIVGRPAPTTPVTVRTGGFQMVVAPNPAKAAAQVTWSGAVAPVRFEVLDARGRRVAAGSGGAAGTWSWGAAGGRPLAAGVYFVQARDSEGRRVVQRFVLVK